MKTDDLKTYETLTTPAERAKWLLRKGVTAKLTINPDKLELAYQACSAGCRLPDYYATSEEAVAKSTAWLAEIAGVAAMPNSMIMPQRVHDAMHAWFS